MRFGAAAFKGSFYQNSILELTINGKRPVYDMPLFLLDAMELGSSFSRKFPVMTGGWGGGGAIFVCVCGGGGGGISFAPQLQFCHLRLRVDKGLHLSCIPPPPPVLKNINLSDSSCKRTNLDTERSSKHGR